MPIDLDYNSLNPLRVHRRRRPPAPRRLVPRRRHRAQRDARRPRPRHSDLRALAPRLGRQLPVEDLGPPQQPRSCQDLAHVAARPRRRHRGRRRHPPRHRPAPDRRAQRHHGRRQRRRPRKNRMSPRAHGCLSALLHRRQHYGYHPNEVAISFDDGPDPNWTPKILDILKQNNVKGTFFMIGEEAENNVGLMQRVYREGHEIGNHTFTHPDISEISHAPGRPRAQPHRAPLRQQARRSAALLPPALRHRRGARHRRPGRAHRAHPEPRLHHRRQQDRHQRLGRASPQDARRRSPTASSTSSPT